MFLSNVYSNTASKPLNGFRIDFTKTRGLSYDFFHLFANNTWLRGVLKGKS